ncbi:MAG: HAMP domain-containing sensor histidine kinase [Synechocystis sp.]|nr:HAMP domain-containing sensor histidine kinase [Synechocystis sp.]
MSLSPQLLPLQDRAAKDFLQATSQLIWSIIVDVKIVYWQIDSASNLILSPDISQHPGQTHPLPADKTFIQTHQDKLQQGKFLLSNRQASCLELDPDIRVINAQYDQLFLGACYQNQYVGGIFLESTSGTWQALHYTFLQAIIHHYACYYYWQNQPMALSSIEKEAEDKSLNLSHIHHEFRTPLSGILGFAKMLREELYGELNAKQHQYVQGILNSAEHLLGLVNDFLDLSKINANCEELFWELVAVEDLCLAVISIVQPKAKERGLGLILEITPGIDFCRLDQRRWKQILLNLLSNAIKFTEEGSVTLKVERRADCLVFSVIDTGIGIKLEDQKKLFLPFKQISNAINRQQKGTGLGLVLSRKLAQLHGGDIRLTSVLGEGSCFEVILPISQDMRD